ncbi:MAG: WD40 repeat domain-containing protein, partial [Cyanobacteria bacterium J06629_18]
EEICTLTGHSGKVNSLAFSPDGQTLFSGSDDNTIKIWQYR